MVRFLVAIALGVVGGLIIHIAVILTIPRVAENNAWGRLSRIGDMYEVVRVEALRSNGAATTLQPAGSDLHDFAFVDPAFITASCRFSLADGPVRLTADARTKFWSASIYNRAGDNLYSINDRSAVDGIFDLLIGTPDQIADFQANVAGASDTLIPVEVSTREGYLTLRVLVSQESARPSVEAFVSALVCEPPAPPTVDAAGSRAG